MHSAPPSARSASSEPLGRGGGPARGRRSATGRPVRLPAWLFAGGIALFSGSLYLLAGSGARWAGPLTPLGGLLLIAGWLALLTLFREGT
jgi:uncharacterized membrane protein YgdD (TMEM256/DUF423 family)